MVQLSAHRMKFVPSSRMVVLCVINYFWFVHVKQGYLTDTDDWHSGSETILKNMVQLIDPTNP